MWNLTHTPKIGISKGFGGICLSMYVRLRYVMLYYIGNNKANKEDENVGGE
jgi:hypothetical protein